jgi:hypothetical protein
MDILRDDITTYLLPAGLVSFCVQGAVKGGNRTVGLLHTRLPATGSYFLDVIPENDLKSISSMTTVDWKFC